MTTLAKTLEGTGGTAQGGRPALVAARLGWGGLVGLSLVLFALSVPARYEELARLARQSLTRLGHGSGLESVRGFLDGGFYAPAVLSLEISFVLALALASAAMVRRNSSDWRPLFISAAFVSYAVWATPTLDALALPGALQTLADLTQAAGLLMAVLFFLLFPDGCFAPGWARLSALGWAIYCLLWGLSFPTCQRLFYLGGSRAASAARWHPRPPPPRGPCCSLVRDSPRTLLPFPSHTLFGAYATILWRTGGKGRGPDFSGPPKHVLVISAATRLCSRSG